MKGKTHKEAAEIREQMKAYKAEGHTMEEVAEKFFMSVKYTQQICKGIAPQFERCHLHNQYTDGSFDRIANCQRIIEKANPNLEYFGGFVNVDSPVDIRCKVCGHVFSRSMITFRHRDKSILCPACDKVRKQEEKEQTRLKRLEESKKHRQDKKIEKMLAKSHVQTSLRFCPVCNTAFIGNKVYCSERCRNQNKWMMKDGYRYKFPLEELYQRDHGICYLCGGLCDWNDKIIVDDVIVYGNTYPSRDHVIPKSQGGENSWNNLRLAHRICNSLKSDAPLVKKNV